MTEPVNFLFPHEFDALLEALRRDLRTQLSLNSPDNAWAEWHQLNAYNCKRLLEILNPKLTSEARASK